MSAQLENESRFHHLYYGWVIVLCAAWAMTTTLPGRTIGLSLVTEPLLQSFDLNRVTFARLNLVSILIGAAFCIPLGSLMDRLGARAMVSIVTAGLGSAVIWMSRAESTPALAVTMTLLRGLGESSLSVISMALVGKWFSRRISLAMGIYSVFIAVGFVAAIVLVGKWVHDFGWREAWQFVGMVILGGGLVIGLLVVRNQPTDSILARKEFSTSTTVKATASDFTLAQAIRTPAFWCFALGAPLYALGFSAISLFNESLLAEQGFGTDKAQELLAIVAGSGVLCNLFGGWLGMKLGMGKLLGGTLLVFAVTLALFPAIRTSAELILYAIAIGGSGGVITVVFFSIWAQMFGRSHLGKIQGAAQICSVLASAAGPLLLAECRQSFGSYTPFFYGVSAAAAIIGIACYVTPTPR